MYLKSIDDAFGYWLAGFTDGEGCFHIQHQRDANSWICSYQLTLRADDRSVLEDIYWRTGMGTLHDQQGAQEGKRKPAARWAIQAKSQLPFVVALFERYPLRGKKARDFMVWKQAVAVWCGAIGYDVERWSRMRILMCQLRNGRAFDCGPVMLSPDDGLDSSQLSLELM